MGLLSFKKSCVRQSAVEELDSVADKFKGRITGIDPVAGLMKMSEEATEAYGLEHMELLEGSGATMTATLADAFNVGSGLLLRAGRHIGSSVDENCAILKTLSKCLVGQNLSAL